jgi:hypothetical protein
MIGDSRGFLSDSLDLWECDGSGARFDHRRLEDPIDGLSINILLSETASGDIFWLVTERSCWIIGRSIFSSGTGLWGIALCNISGITWQMVKFIDERFTMLASVALLAQPILFF